MSNISTTEIQSHIHKKEKERKKANIQSTKSRSSMNEHNPRLQQVTKTFPFFGRCNNLWTSVSNNGMVCVNHMPEYESLWERDSTRGAYLFSIRWFNYLYSRSVGWMLISAAFSFSHFQNGTPEVQSSLCPKVSTRQCCIVYARVGWLLRHVFT